VKFLHRTHAGADDVKPHLRGQHFATFIFPVVLLLLPFYEMIPKTKKKNRYNMLSTAMKPLSSPGFVPAHLPPDTEGILFRRVRCGAGRKLALLGAPWAGHRRNYVLGNDTPWEETEI